MKWWLVGVSFMLIMVSVAHADWRTHQRDYQELVGAPLPREGVDVIRNDDLGIEDRCVSCHVGIDDPRTRDAAQPLRTHSGRYLRDHPFREFGCTTCHGGVGNTVDKRKAHGEGTSKALLKGDMIETRCTTCHDNHTLPGAPSLTHGYALIQKLGCTGCHELEGFTTKGPPCPRLDAIGSKVQYKWLKRWLMKPKDFLPKTTMPDAHLTSDQAEALASYLMTFKNSTLDATPDPVEGDPDEGGKIVRSVRCISCHSFNGKGGSLAPDLGRIGNKVTYKWLVAMLKDTRTHMPNTTMPQFNFTDQQAADVASFLLDEYTDYDLLDEYEADGSTPSQSAETIDIGRRIFKELRCADCHAHPTGGGSWMKLAPILTGIGDKPPTAFNFGNSDIPRTTWDYIFEKVRHPRAFASETNRLKMPDYHLSDEDAKDITLALLSSRNNKIASRKYRVPVELPSVYEPSGKAGKLFEKFQCFSCHSVNGRGYNLAYDLSMEGSRVRRRWLRNYLDLPYSIRPILVERMPIFGMTDDEATALTDYIMTELKNPAVPESLEKELTPDMAKRGRQLFEEKGCISCHIVNGKGGYVGPSFTIGAQVGDKLQAGWVYQWLKNPQAIMPNVVEPNYKLTDAEAKAITAYLMSFRKEENR